MTWWDDIRYFKPKEFLCSCCGEEHMEESFVRILDELRSRSMTPLKVSSGWRCPKHDEEIHGSGNHPTGLAADIACWSSGTRYILLRNALSLSIPRIGIGKGFIHLDTNPDKPRFVTWLY